MSLKGMFSDDTGNFSSIRVYSLIALIIAIVVTFTGSTIDIICVWLVAAFTPKAIQKFAEKKQV